MSSEERSLAELCVSNVAWRDTCFIIAHIANKFCRNVDIHIQMCNVKGRSDFKENCLRLSVVGGCHGSYLGVVGAM